MARAVSPVIPGFETMEVHAAKNQPQYETLPYLPLLDEGQNVLTRWEFSPEEVALIVEKGYCYVYTMTFGQSIQPMYVVAEEMKLGVKSLEAKP